MVNIYARNYRVLRCARVEVNWSLVLDYHETRLLVLFLENRVSKGGGEAEEERRKDGERNIEELEEKVRN